VQDVPEPQRVVIDLEAFTEPDPGLLEALVRLQLTAMRFGTRVELKNACPKLVDLLELVGVDALLGLERLGVEREGNAEQREQFGADEVVEGGDLSV
jgi:hypothetical protein